jgi:hypothetical protein
MLRVGGPGGPLIHWPDRGQGGQYTWSSQDPIGETRDISPWVGNAPRIRLYALVFQVGEVEGAQCEMVTLYNGELCCRWRFDGDEDHEIALPFPGAAY